MSKIAVLGDIHGNNYLLIKLLEILGKENIDEYIICGDNITDGFENNQIVYTLRKNSKCIIAGNREMSVAYYDGISWRDNPAMKSMVYAFDELTLENKLYLKSLPIYKIFEIDGKKICVSHGSPYNVRDAVDDNSEDMFDNLLKDYPSDVYIFAHTHSPFKRVYEGKLFINPGSVSLPVNLLPCSCYGVLTIYNNSVTYEQRKYFYDFENIKDYYVNSLYHRECFEWSNLLLNILKYSKNYHCDFIDFWNRYSNGKRATESLWREKFYEYMKINNLDIY